MALPRIDVPVMKIPLKNILDKIENLPGSSNDGKSEGKCNTKERPWVRVNTVEKVEPTCILSTRAGFDWEFSTSCDLWHFIILS